MSRKFRIAWLVLCVIMCNGGKEDTGLGGKQIIAFAVVGLASLMTDTIHSHLDYFGWGTKEELEAAYTIIRNSLDKAGYALTTQDIEHARKHGLLTKQELQAVNTYQAKSKLKSFRKGREGRDRDNDFER